MGNGRGGSKPTPIARLQALAGSKASHTTGSSHKTSTRRKSSGSSSASSASSGSINRKQPVDYKSVREEILKGYRPRTEADAKQKDVKPKLMSKSKVRCRCLLSIESNSSFIITSKKGSNESGGEEAESVGAGASTKVNSGGHIRVGKIVVLLQGLDVSRCAVSLRVIHNY